MRFQDRLSLQGFIPEPDGSPQLTAWPLLLASLAAVGSLGMLLWETRTRWLLPDGQPWRPGYLTAEQPPVEIPATAHSGRPRLGTLILAAAAQAAFLAALWFSIDWAD